ncbi:MAG TPA: PIN domain-containing protein [Chloroflexota bacterium]|nr:PIN domain-containing protein [Chloroflexota bacterium]
MSRSYYKTSARRDSVDTSGLVASYDRSDRNHANVAAWLSNSSPPRILSPFVAAELDYLILNKLGRVAELAVLEDLASGAYLLPHPDSADVQVAAGMLKQHEAIDLGLTDASIAVLSQRFGSVDVLTLDHRHFRAITTPSGMPFRLLPADGPDVT